MKLTLPDGSILETTDPIEIAQIVDLLGLRPKVKTQAEQLRAKLDRIQGRAINPTGLDFSQVTIEELDLVVRTYNVLKRNGILTVGDIVKRSPDELNNLRNFGQRSVDELECKLADLGLALKPNPVYDPVTGELEEPPILDFTRPIYGTTAIPEPKTTHGEATK